MFLTDDEGNKSHKGSVVGYTGWGRAGAGTGDRYLLHDVTVAVAGSQVQWGVIPPVHDVDASPPHDEHVHHIGTALAAGPVQGAEPMVIPAGWQGPLLSCSPLAQASLASSSKHQPWGPRDRVEHPSHSHPHQGPTSPGQILSPPRLNHSRIPSPSPHSVAK